MSHKPVHTQCGQIRPDDFRIFFLTKAFFGKIFEGEMFIRGERINAFQIFCEL